MENFYKITKAEAEIISYFEYATNQAVDPFAGEQKDGSYIISEIVYQLLKDHPKFKQIDFSNKQKVGQDKLQPKEEPLITLPKIL